MYHKIFIRFLLLLLGINFLMFAAWADNTVSPAGVKRLNAVHSIVYRAPQDHPLKFFGWPTVIKDSNRKIIAGASGFRAAHICPFGMSVLWESTNDGKSWSPPKIIHNSVLDCRDVGLTPLSGGDFLVSWFTYNTQRNPNCVRAYPAFYTAQHPEMVEEELGSYVRKMHADGTGGAPVKVKVSAPHGPIRLANGHLFYLGIPFGKTDKDGVLKFTMPWYDTNQILAMVSDNEGATWKELGTIEPWDSVFLGEPHALELPNGKIIGVFRDNRTFQTWQTCSEDGGLTWSHPHLVIPHGAPPHLIRHSSGVLILSYGYRQKPFGERIALSYDDGNTWDIDWILRDDGPERDLGYPSTVELSDGSLLTVYYQQCAPGESPSILASHWTLPERTRPGIAPSGDEHKPPRQSPSMK